MAKKTVSTTFPMVQAFGDYHDIDFYAEDINPLFAETIRCAEIGYSAGSYWGVFYVGRKPAKAVIDQLLEDSDYVELEEY